MVSFALVFWDVMQLFLWMNIASQVLVPLPLVEKMSKMCAMTCGVYLSGTQALLLDVAPPKIWGLITGFEGHGGCRRAKRRNFFHFREISWYEGCLDRGNWCDWRMPSRRAPDI